MNKLKFAKQIQEILDEHFPSPPIPLKSTSTYTFLIAVLLSAQCTDERVNIVTPKLFKGAETPEKMMERSVEEIQELIKTCGLSRTKARHIKGLSKILVEKYKGEVPEELDQARQHFKNLFETTVLFYVLIAFIYASNSVNQLDLIFAWIYVVFKYMHSYIRLTSNYVPYRANLFILSILMILCGWINFLFN